MIEKTRDGYGQDDWQKHYDENDLAWDLGEVSEPFVRLLQDRQIPEGRLVIPGCGQGHEVRYFAQNGWQVTGVDFAAGAVSLLRQLLEKHGLDAEVLHRNFFELEGSHDARYDALLEQTFFCAIHPDQRETYVNTVSRILKPGGVIAGLFYETGEEGGPPFNTTEADILRHFSENFEIERLERCCFSHERRKDKEWLAVLRKK